MHSICRNIRSAVVNSKIKAAVDFTSQLISITRPVAKLERVILVEVAAVKENFVGEELPVLGVAFVDFL